MILSLSSDDTDGHQEALEMRDLGGAQEGSQPLRKKAGSPPPPQVSFVCWL